MKQCTRCEVELPLSKYKITNNKTGKISSMCNDCRKEYDREFYAANRERTKENTNKLKRERRARKRMFIIDYLKQCHCADCGNKDWRVLEFDHRVREEKLFNISDAMSYSLEKIKAEIVKCDIVCSNCHIIRTITQLGYYKFLK